LVFVFSTRPLRVLLDAAPDVVHARDQARQRHIVGSTYRRAPRPRTQTIDHPQFGELELDRDVLSVHGMDLRIIVFTAAPNSAAAGKLRLLTVLGTEEMAPPRSIDVS